MYKYGVIISFKFKNMNTISKRKFTIIAFGKQRGLQCFYQTGYKGFNIERLIEHLQLDLDEMPLRRGELLYSKILLPIRGVMHTFFLKYQFTLDAYGRKGFRAIAIGLKGKKIQNWEDAIRLASILKALPMHEFSILDFYLKQLETLETKKIIDNQIVEELPYIFPSTDHLSEIELATFIYISIFEASHLPYLAKLYLTDSTQILKAVNHPNYEIVEEKDFEKYIESFAFSLYERQAQILETAK
jgi:hypothetical protein